MAVIANSRLYVTRPGALVPRFGLFNVANGPLDLNIHARQSGMEFESVACDLPTGFAVECPAATTKSFTSGAANKIDVDPFVVRSDLECAPVGLTDIQLRQWLIDRLKAGEQATVERIFSDGTFGASPTLQGATPLAASSSIIKAVGLLEDWLYSRYGLPGVIHVPALAAQQFIKDAELIMQSGGQWKTAMGTLVSFGNYSGKGPSAEVPAAGSLYLYITGQVTVWRAPDADIYTTPLSEALDRTTNQVYGQAEREYAIGYECFAASTLTTL